MATDKRAKKSQANFEPALGRLPMPLVRKDVVILHACPVKTTRLSGARIGACRNFAQFVQAKRLHQPQKQKSPMNGAFRGFKTSVQMFQTGFGGVDGTRTRDPRRDRPVF
jgi:hypothetical protein